MLVRNRKRMRCKMAYLAWALVNIANVTVFGLLAYHFNKWWIILFSLLISYSVKTNNKECGRDE